MKIQESGRSMIEMLGVLAIVGVLSVGGFRIYAQAMHKYRVYKLTSQVIDTIQHVRKFYEGAGVYNSLSAFALKEGLDLTAFELDTTAKKLTHIMAGKAEVTQCSRLTVGDNKAFCIVLYDLKRDECADLLVQTWSGQFVAIGSVVGDDFDESDYMDSSANRGRTVKDGNKIVAYSGAIPIALGDAATACAGTDNTLFFKLK